MGHPGLAVAGVPPRPSHDREWAAVRRRPVPSRAARPVPSSDSAGYLVWRPHPKTGEDAPVGFALVDGLERDRRSVVGFWVAPVVRREGVGRVLAVEVLSRHNGPWSIGFQHENVAAGVFWRDVANAVFSPGRWSEEQRPVPGLSDVPPDHFIESF